jgi:hypothetical protein
VLGGVSCRNENCTQKFRMDNIIFYLREMACEDLDLTLLAHDRVQ